MVGIINSDIKLLRLKSFLQAICSFLMVNFSSFIRIMGIEIYNIGHKKAEIG